ncbi:MAG: sporulation protein YqfD [Ruminococcus sp.]|nr:sporulation protein YqfD [Ruminococcus sp.]
MLNNVLRWLRGYVEFEGVSKCPERFLNLTVRRGIRLWDAYPTPNGVCGKLRLSDYRAIRPTARKCRIHLHITERRGLPFIAARYRKRKGLAVGAALGLALLLFLSQFVWTVEFSGQSSVSDAQLRVVLQQNGLYVGCCKGFLDVDKIKRQTLLQVEELGWMSVNLKGSRALVEVREKAQKPPVSTNSQPCNIKAACDGVVTKLRVRRGTAKTLRGSGVRKGDLLVSGVRLTEQNTISYVCSDADVFADVYSDKELFIPNKLDYYSLTENKAERRRLYFLHGSLPVSFVPTQYRYTAFTENRQGFLLNSVPLPVGLQTETAHELYGEQVKLNRDKADKAAQNAFALYEAFEKGGSKIVKKQITVTPVQNGYRCISSYTFNENIAQTVDFNVEKE